MTKIKTQFCCRQQGMAVVTVVAVLVALTMLATALLATVMRHSETARAYKLKDLARITALNAKAEAIGAISVGGSISGIVYPFENQTVELPPDRDIGFSFYDYATATADDNAESTVGCFGNGSYFNKKLHYSGTGSGEQVYQMKYRYFIIPLDACINVTRLHKDGANDYAVPGLLVNVDTLNNYYQIENNVGSVTGSLTGSLTGYVYGDAVNTLTNLHETYFAPLIRDVTDPDDPLYASDAGHPRSRLGYATFAELGADLTSGSVTAFSGGMMKSTLPYTLQNKLDRNKFVLDAHTPNWLIANMLGHYVKTAAQYEEDYASTDHTEFDTLYGSGSWSFTGSQTKFTSAPKKNDETIDDWDLPIEKIYEVIRDNKMKSQSEIIHAIYDYSGSSSVSTGYSGTITIFTVDDTDPANVTITINPQVIKNAAIEQVVYGLFDTIVDIEDLDLNRKYYLTATENAESYTDTTLTGSIGRFECSLTDGLYRVIIYAAMVNTLNHSVSSRQQLEFVYDKATQTVISQRWFDPE